MRDPCLLIETSGRGGFVALAVNGVVLGERVLDPARRHNRDLAGFATELFAVAGLSPRDVRSVAVSVGPGSYTGLRVGLISAKVFAYAVGCDLIAVPTFAAVAELAPATFARLDVICDGLQGLVYCQRYERVDGTMTAATDLRILSAADWLATEPAAVSGPGVAAFDGVIPDAVARVADGLRIPTATSLLAAAGRIAPATPAERFGLEPLYLRPSSAEEQATRKATQSLASS